MFNKNDLVGLNYKSFGDGEPIIILHGLFGMLDNWQSFGKALSDDYQVFLVDQRNHGKSFHDDQFTYRLLAEDLKTFLDEQHISNAHILGHSMGGKTAMTFASEYAESVNSLIIVDIAPRQYQGGHETLFDAILNIDIRQVQNRKEVNEQLSLSIPNDGVRLFLMKNMTRHPEGGYRWKANFEVLHREYQSIMGIEELNSYDKKSLFVKGEHSDYISIDDEGVIKSYFPQANIIEIEGAGHWVHAEKPNALLEIVRRFLKS